MLVTLVELLAYAGDSLSYFQDAVATEAYLGTARRRASVRRHARLVDYHVHDGANARAWVVARAGPGADGAVLPRGTMVLTGEVGAPTTLGDGRRRPRRLAGALVFETLHPLALREARNEIPLYTWGDPRCCLPAGATRATLVGSRRLAAPSDRRRADLRGGAWPAARRRRGGIRDHGPAPRRTPTPRTATRSGCAAEPVARTDPAGRVEVVEIEWHAADALPFPLCAWDLGTEAEPVPVSVARGNVVLADHGRHEPGLEASSSARCRDAAPVPAGARASPV